MSAIVGVCRRPTAHEATARSTMSDSVFGVLDLVLAFGLAIGWGVRELILLRRDARKTKRDSSEE